MHGEYIREHKVDIYGCWILGTLDKMDEQYQTGVGYLLAMDVVYGFEWSMSCDLWTINMKWTLILVKTIKNIMIIIKSIPD